MEFITGKHIPRRTFLRGLGATLALPYLDAMVPAARIARAAAADPTRLVCIEFCHGMSGCAEWGIKNHLFAPEKVGRDFELIPASALKPLEPWRKYMTIVSNTDMRMGEAYDAPEI